MSCSLREESNVLFSHGRGNAVNGRMPQTLREDAMATVLFVVKATITKDREEAFNRWYNDEHVLQVLQFKGVVSARRYKALEGEEKFQYMAVYELHDEATYRRLMASPHMKLLHHEPAIRRLVLQLVHGHVLELLLAFQRFVSARAD